MKFISTSSKDDSLYHYTLYLLGKPATDTTSYSSSDWVRSSKVYYRKAAYFIWKNDAGWEFDDSNYTTLPIATTDLVDDQQDYSLPSNALDVQRVEVARSDGKFVLLNRMNKDEVTNSSLTSYYSTNGLPKYYDVIGNSLMLYPAPDASNTTLTGGLKLYLERDVSVPTMTTGNGALRDITQEPGFHIDFHPYIAIGCALDYGVSKNYVKEKMDNLKALYQDYLSQLEYYYSRRDRDYPVKFRPGARSSI